VTGWRRNREVPELRILSLNRGAEEAVEFRLLKSEATIGSGENNQFVIRRASVSRRHASVAFRRNRYEISDLGSTNGTFVNGQRVKTPVLIEIGDEIRFGDATFILAKPAGSRILPSRRRNSLPRKVLTSRGALEVIVLAFAVGFGAAQCLAYLMYHAQNRLILAEAVPINQGPRTTPNRRAAQTQPKAQVAASAKVGEVPRATLSHRAAPSMPSRTKSVPVAPRVATHAPPSTLNSETVTAKNLAGGVALAQLIEGSGTDAGELAPAFALPDLAGADVALHSMRGKVVLLNFWATWCPHCRSEMPSLEKLYRNFRSYRDFALLTVNVDRRGKPVVKQFMASGGYNFPVLLDPSNRTSAAYGVSGIPSTFVIGRDGQIIWNCVGGLDWSNPTIRDALKKLL
jgi:pSer/pThr/pTyr-binding forkhead associated (FHA) protein/peroxiredoxin